MANSLLVITGAPRSGVAVLGGCLRILGLSPLVYPENPDASAINMLLMQDLEFGPLMAGSLPGNWLETRAADTARQRANSLLTGYDFPKNNCFLADPLFCRTLPLWIEMLRENSIEPEIIHILRHPWEVALSLHKNENTNLPKAHLIWLTYIRDAFRHWPNQKTITFDQLLADPVSILRYCLNSSHLADHSLPANELLGYVQPSLKHHNAADLLQQDQTAFQVFNSIYQELRLSRYTSLADKEMSAEIIENQLIRDPSSCSGLIDNLLQTIGQYEARELRHTGTGKAGQALFAKVIFPSSGQNGQIEETIPLIPDEWQKVSLPVPEPELLSNTSVTLKPLNTKGTVNISGIKAVNKATEKTLWSAQSPQDFDALTINREYGDRLIKLTILLYFATFLSTQQPQALTEVHHAKNSQIY